MMKMKTNNCLEWLAAGMRLAGIAFMGMDMFMSGNPISSIYYYFPYLFLILEFLLYCGRTFFGMTSLYDLPHALIYYVILVLAYTLWNQTFSIALAILYLAGFVLYFYLDHKDQRSKTAPKRKY